MEARTVAQAIARALTTRSMDRYLSWNHPGHVQPTSHQAFPTPLDAALPGSASCARERNRDLRDPDGPPFSGRGAGEALRGDRAHGGSPDPGGADGRALPREHRLA